MMAVLYRTNAQSRAIEDSLMRESVPYKIIGGVRFYERKEIKDALAYLKLIINPHDDVSLRRVINVPARGIGKGVMDSLQAIDPEGGARGRAAAARRRPAGGQLRPIAVGQARVRRGRGQAGARARSPRCGSSAISSSASPTWPGRESVSIAIGKMLDRTGYLNDLRDENTEEANERIENLMELVSAAREYETREPEASLGGFVDRLSLLSEADEESGTREAKVWLMTMHAAKGLEFPMVIIAGLEEGLFPHSRSGEDDEELEEERRLCYVGMTRAESQLVLTERGTAPRIRRVSVDRSRHASSTRSPPSCSIASRRLRVGAIRARSRTRTTSSGPTRTLGEERRRRFKEAEAELRVRGRGSVHARQCDPACASATRSSASARSLSVEEHNDDLKITVRFNRSGSKKLLAKFAKLEPA